MASRLAITTDVVDPSPICDLGHPMTSMLAVPSKPESLAADKALRIFPLSPGSSLERET